MHESPLQATIKLTWVLDDERELLTRELAKVDASKRDSHRIEHHVIAHLHHPLH